MKIKTSIKYEVAYLPTPRSRKYRYREESDIIELPLQMTTKPNLVKAFNDHSYEGKGLIFSFARKLWTKAKITDICAYDAVSSQNYETPLEALIWWQRHGSQFYKLEWTRVRYGEDTSKEAVIAQAKKYLDNFLLVGQDLYITTPEPVYTVETFGCRGDGTSLMVSYGSDLNAYYSALDSGAAIAKAIRTAREKGDFDCIQNFSPLIDVYNPAFVTKKTTIPGISTVAPEGMNAYIIRDNKQLELTDEEITEIGIVHNRRQLLKSAERQFSLYIQNNYGDQPDSLFLKTELTLEELVSPTSVNYVFDEFLAQYAVRENADESENHIWNSIFDDYFLSLEAVTTANKEYLASLAFKDYICYENTVDDEKELIEFVEKYGIHPDNALDEDSPDYIIPNIITAYDHLYPSGKDTYAENALWEQAVIMALGLRTSDTSGNQDDNCTVASVPDCKLDFYNCIWLLNDCIKSNILQTDPNNKNNVLIYRLEGTSSPAGWYSQNVMSVANDLVNDINGQRTLLNALKEKNISFELRTFK